VTAKHGQNRLIGIQATAWVLIGMQVVVLGPSIGREWHELWFRDQMARVQDRVQRVARLSAMVPRSRLRRGMRVRAIPARTITSAVVDLLTHARDRQAIVFVSSCAPGSCALHRGQLAQR
jgi:hypothetical protein